MIWKKEFVNVVVLHLKNKVGADGCANIAALVIPPAYPAPSPQG